LLKAFRAWKMRIAIFLVDVVAVAFRTPGGMLPSAEQRCPASLAERL